MSLMDTHSLSGSTGNGGTRTGAAVNIPTEWTRALESGPTPFVAGTWALVDDVQLDTPPQIATGTKHHEHGYLVQLCDALATAWLCDVYALTATGWRWAQQCCVATAELRHATVEPRMSGAPSAQASRGEWPYVGNERLGGNCPTLRIL